MKKKVTKIWIISKMLQLINAWSIIEQLVNKKLIINSNLLTIKVQEKVIERRKISIMNWICQNRLKKLNNKIE